MLPLTQHYSQTKKLTILICREERWTLNLSTKLVAPQPLCGTFQPPYNTMQPVLESSPLSYTIEIGRNTEPHPSPVLRVPWRTRLGRKCKCSKRPCRFYHSSWINGKARAELSWGGTGAKDGERCLTSPRGHAYTNAQVQARRRRVRLVCGSQFRRTALCRSTCTC